jgi:hypothetical protein
LRVAARRIATENLQGRLCQCAHMLIVKRVLGNVTLGFDNTAVHLLTNASPNCCFALWHNGIANTN